jgi:hypothetical protein
MFSSDSRPGLVLRTRPKPEVGTDNGDSTAALEPDIALMERQAKKHCSGNGGYGP